LGNASEAKDVANSDLVVKVVVEENPDIKFRRVNDNIQLDCELSLIEAIFGCNKEIETIEKKKEKFEVNPGTQNDDKFVFKNQVKLIKF
jgi:DnaJ-class molecular chaperone